MIIGAHSIIYSKNSQADRVFLRDVLKLDYVDMGDGWLIFGLPPAELAVHPSHENGKHEFYFMVKDIDAFIQDMKAHQIVCSLVENRDWGLLTHLTLPGGGQIGVYQPRHARPKSIRHRSASKKSEKSSRLRPRK